MIFVAQNQKSSARPRGLASWNPWALRPRAPTTSPASGRPHGAGMEVDGTVSYGKSHENPMKILENPGKSLENPGKSHENHHFIHFYWVNLGKATFWSLKNMEDVLELC